MLMISMYDDCVMCFVVLGGGSFVRAMAGGVGGQTLFVEKTQRGQSRADSSAHICFFGCV
jgi:hypothetical protein